MRLKSVVFLIVTIGFPALLCAQTGISAGPGGSISISGGGSGCGVGTPCAIAAGGTNATSAAAALANLGGLPVTGGTLTGSLNGISINVGTFADYGDSLTAGNEGVVQTDTFPSLLQVKAGVQSINFGVGGTTSTQIAVRAGATASSIQVASGNIPACSTLTCSSLTAAFPLGYEPTANSTTGGGTVPVTGTIATTPAIHGTIALSLYQGTATWSISGGTATITGLVLVAGSSVVPAAGVAIEANAFTGASGCADINGPHRLTGGTSTTASFSTTCTGSGSGGVVSIYTFTPDSYTAGATISGTPAWTTDSPCPSCSVIAWPGRNNLFANGSFPAGISIVEGSVSALAAIVPTGKQFVVMPVIPENISSEWSGGGGYSTLTTYRTWLQTNYANSFVDVWTSLQNAGNSSLPTDARDVVNGNIPTSLRAITATGTLHASILSTDTALQIDVTNGILAANQVVTLDVGVSTAAENVVCSSVTGSSNPYSLSGCTRGYGGSTAFAHSGGAVINQDDGTHLNQAGYTVVANAIAAHLGIVAGTSPATTPQLNRSVTLGGVKVQNHFIGGDVQGGLQLVFGNTGTIKNATGSVNALSVIGAQFSAYNAMQTGGYGIDQWSQSYPGNRSYMTLMGTNGWGVYAALPSSSANPFASFWGATPSVAVNTAFVSNIQTVFNYPLTSFKNAADTTNTIQIQAGVTADQGEVLQFLDKNQSCLWEILKESSFNSLRHFDCQNSIYRFIETLNGETVLNSGSGANAFRVNSSAGSGTGGLVIESGGGSPVVWGSLTSAGLTLSGAAAGSGNDCLQINTAGLVTNTGSPCPPSGVSSIDSQTGAFTFTGAGVSHVGNAYTFSGGGGSGVSSINSTTGAFTFTGSGVSCAGVTCTFSGGAPGGAFSSLTGGTNTTAAMIVGSGASLSFSGTGTINANQIAGGTSFTGNQGNGAKVQHSTGTTAAGDCAEFDANGNTVDAGSGCGTGGVAPVSVTVPSFAIPSNTCYGSTGSTTPATFTMTGITTAMGITPDFISNPASVVGWGASGGLGIKVYSSATNTGSYVICNPTSGSITGDSITFLMSSSSGGSGGGSGSISIVSSGNLAPLFTTSVSNATTTPAISYTLSNAAQNTILSGPTSGSGVPSYRALVGGDLPAQYRIRNCSVGLGDGVNAIPSGTYPIKGQCRNLYGVTYTITGVQCFSDNNGTSTGNVADSAANALLTGSITATSSWANGTQSGTTTLGTNVWANWTIVADGASKQIQCTMTGTI